MFQFDLKIIVCLIISILLVIPSGLVGIVLGANSQELFPSFLTNYLPKVDSSKIVLPKQLKNEAVKGIFLEISGKVWQISPDEVTVEANGELLTLKVGKNKMELRSYPDKEQLKMIKKGEAVSLGAKVAEDGLEVIFLVMQPPLVTPTVSVAP